MHILLTNDDSHDSPLFLLAIEILQGLGDVSIVVPAQEQSWKGKSMTRFGELYVDRIDLHGHAAWSVSGTPADCVSLGIYNLFMASGTLGACFEANIARLPAIALSQAMTFEDHRAWYTTRSFPEASLERMAGNTRKVLPEVWQEFAVSHHEPVTWSINLPDPCESPDPSGENLLPALLLPARRSVLPQPGALPHRRSAGHGSGRGGCRSRQRHPHRSGGDRSDSERLTRPEPRH